MWQIKYMRVILNFPTGPALWYKAARFGPVSRNRAKAQGNLLN
jgi:hypothetical protein